MTFASPIGALVAIAVAIPLGAVWLARRRTRTAAHVLDLPAPSRTRTATTAAAVVVIVGSLSLAAAEPQLRDTHSRTVRTSSEALFVVDVSRSMSAASTPRAESRLDRAREIASRMRSSLPDVRSGLAGFTDRVLPYLFPTGDATVFRSVVGRSVIVDSPPPAGEANTATDFGALTAIGTDNFFDRSANHRTCVLLTDGETKPYPIAATSRAFHGARGCRLIVIHLGSPAERVFGPSGVPDIGYTPVGDGRANVDALAAAAGGRSYDEGEIAGAERTLRAFADVGPAGRESIGTDTRPLGRYAAALALIVAALVVVSRMNLVPRRLSADASR